VPLFVEVGSFVIYFFVSVLIGFIHFVGIMINAFVYLTMVMADAASPCRNRTTDEST